MSRARTDQLRSFTNGLIRLARIYRREVNRTLIAHGLSDSRALPVLQIARSGSGLRQGVLAEELGLEGPSLARLLDQICSAGLAERRDDPSDGRAKTLHITEAGQDLAATLEKILRDLRSRLMVNVSDGDLSATLRVFATLETALDAAEAKARKA
jgi:MarR family transcriptional regulator for hemolysin